MDDLQWRDMMDVRTRCHQLLQNVHGESNPHLLTSSPLPSPQQRRPGLLRPLLPEVPTHRVIIRVGQRSVWVVEQSAGGEIAVGGGG